MVWTFLLNPFSLPLCFRQIKKIEKHSQCNHGLSKRNTALQGATINARGDRVSVSQHSVEPDAGRLGTGDDGAAGDASSGVP